MKNSLRLFPDRSTACNPERPIANRRFRLYAPNWLLTGLLLLGISNLSWGQCFNASTISLGYTTDPSSDSPTSEATGDFNGDGKLDLAVVGFSSNNVGVLLNMGNGNFGPVTNFAVGSSPRSVAAGDFNGDGKLDLAVGNVLSNDVSILLNTGGGSFGAATNFPVGTYPGSIAVGDFNSDGKPDLATVNTNSNNVSVLLNAGGGNFSGATNVAVGTLPNSIVGGDFNGDGKADLATANAASNNVSILLGNGSGSFSPAPSIAAGSTPYKITKGDFNGDSRLDLAVLTTGTSAVVILLGNGSGGFGAAPTISLGFSSYSIDAGDFNGDGKTDLVVTGYSTNSVVVFLSNGNGTFGTGTAFSTGVRPVVVSAGDFNGDGKIDIVASRSDDGLTPANVAIFLGRGDGTFGASGNVVNPISVVVADFNKDGKPDMAVASFLSNNVSVLLNNGSGGFGTATSFLAGSHPTSVATGDFNKDGNPDLAVTNLASDNISILLGTGTGNFGMAPNVALQASSGPETVAVADVNGDGNPDLVTANSGSGILSDFSIVLGKGDGSFGAAKNLSLSNAFQGIAIGDFNGDAYADFVTTDYNNSRVSAFLSNGTGSIGDYRSFGVGSNPTSVAVGDFNGDGKADLAVANLGSATISVLLGAGNGDFGVATNYPANSNPYSIVTGDFNADGKLDLAVTNNSADKVSILAGNGSGGFGAANSFPVGDNPVSAAVGDFNGDGKPDLVTANYNSNNVSLLLNCTATANTAPTVANAIPNQTGTVGQAFTYAIPANTFTDAETPAGLTLSATGLPAGLSLTGTTISGTPNASGVSTVTIRATDPGSLFANANFTITINPAATVPTGPATLTITSFNCFSTNNALSSVNFVVGYSDGTFAPALPNLFINGVTITGQLGQTYTFGFDGNQSYLPIQDQNTRSTYFIWNFRAACAGGSTPPVTTAPVAPALPNQMATQGSLFSYVVPAFSGTAPITYSATGLPGGLSFNAASRTISGTPTGTGVSTVQITASNSVGMSTGMFTITVNGATPPSTPGSLTITNFTCNYTSGVLSSVNFVVGYSGGTFTPALPNLFINGVTITGQLGQTYSFGFDVNQSFLPIQDQNTRSTYFIWNFRQACLGGSPRIGAESITPWQAQLLGNPVRNEITVLVAGAQGQSLQLELTDMAGHVVDSRRISPTAAEHREVFDVQRQGAGLLLLQAIGDEHRQTLKVLKQ